MNDVEVRRIRFDEPEDLSPLVADLYRWWYRRRRMIANRLVVDSFILMDPIWTLRTGSAGLAGPERWRKILKRAGKEGSLPGVDPDHFPRDFATLARYHDQIQGSHRDGPGHTGHASADS